MCQQDDKRQNEIPEIKNMFKGLSDAEKIALLNSATAINYRSAPYILNDPTDFRNMLTSLVGTYMDVVHYYGDMEEITEQHSQTMVALDPENKELQICGVETDIAVVETCTILYAALDLLGEAMRRAQKNLVSTLHILLAQTTEFRSRVLGVQCEVPEYLHNGFIQLCMCVGELPHNGVIENSYTTFISHMRDCLLEDLDVAQQEHEEEAAFFKLLGEVDLTVAQEMFSVDPEDDPEEEKQPKLQFVPKSHYDRNDENELQTLFLISVGVFLDYHSYWLSLTEIVESLDETLEYTDAATYFDYILSADAKETEMVSALKELEFALDRLSDNVHVYQTELENLLRFILTSSAPIQKSILNASYDIGSAEMDHAMEILFDNVGDLDNEYFFEKNRDNFVSYMGEMLKSFLC